MWNAALRKLKLRKREEVEKHEIRLNAQMSDCPRQRQPIRLSDADRIDLLGRCAADPDCLGMRMDHVEQTLARSRGQLLGIVNRTEQRRHRMRVSRQDHRSGHYRASPCPPPNLVDAGNVLVARAPELGLERKACASPCRLHFVKTALGGCRCPNHMNP